MYRALCFGTLHSNLTNGIIYSYIQFHFDLSDNLLLYKVSFGAPCCLSSFLWLWLKITRDIEAYRSELGKKNTDKKNK